MITFSCFSHIFRFNSCFYHSTISYKEEYPMKKILMVFLIGTFILLSGCATNQNDKSDSETNTAQSEKAVTQNTPPKTGNKPFDAELKSLSQQYDDLTKRAKDFAKNPETFSADEQQRFTQDQETLATTFQKISTQLTKLAEQGDIRSIKKTEILEYIENRNSDLLDTIDKWPEEIKDKFTE